MDMSLDDYINSFTPSNANNKQNGYSNKSESNFKEGRRQPNDKDEDEEIVLQCQEDDYVSLALENDDRTLVRREPDDLRNKIGLLPSASSQQWRLMQPNVMHTRPLGMPPLVPSDLLEHSLSGNRGNWRNYNHKYRRNYNKSNNFNNHNLNNHNLNNHNFNNNNFNNKNRNNGRINRVNMNTRCNLNSKNIKLVLEQLKERNPLILYPDVGASNLTIEASTNDQQRSNMITQIRMPTSIKSNLPQLPPTEINVQPTGSDTMRSLLGVGEIGLKHETMPSLASKLIDFLNGVNSTSHKPQYDMKIQKEIHDIQKKPLLYKCPGGEVVSSDGVGIPDCRIHPKTSGVSLNNRFA